MPPYFEIMPELIFFKTIKFLIALLTWTGVAMIGIDQITEGGLSEFFHINKSTQLIVTWMVIVLLGIKIVWFVVDKFLEWKERMANIKNILSKESDK